MVKKISLAVLLLLTTLFAFTGVKRVKAVDVNYNHDLVYYFSSFQMFDLQSGESVIIKDGFIEYTYDELNGYYSFKYLYFNIGGTQEDSGEIEYYEIPLSIYIYEDLLEFTNRIGFSIGEFFWLDDYSNAEIYVSFYREGDKQPIYEYNVGTFQTEVLYHFFRKAYQIDVSNTFFNLVGVDSLLFNDVTNGYTMGYNQGKENGYQLGVNAGYNDGYNAGLQVGEEAGVNAGYSLGYQDGLAVAENNFTSLFSGIANTPIMIMYSVLSFDVFGISMFTILFSILTLLMFLWLLKRFIK